MSNKIKSKDVGIMKNERSIANSIFSKEKNINEVYLYGSRVKNNYRKESDYDFGINVKDKENDTEMLLIRLKEEFAESNFPYLVSFVLDNKHQSKEDNFSKEYNKEKKLFYKRHKNKDNKDNVKENKKEKMSKGYGLHVRRLGYAGADSMRSIKYPIHFEDQEVKDKIITKIEEDYKNLTGLLNVRAFFQEKEKYSVMDFWLDCLRMGVVFQPSVGEVMDMFQKITGQSQFDSFVKEIKVRNNNLLTYFDVQKIFDKYIKTTGVRWKEKDGNFKKSKIGEIKDKEYNINQFILDITKDEYKEIDKSKKYIKDKILSINESAIKLIKEIMEGVFNKTGEEQNIFWKEYTGFEKKSKKKNGYDYTFFISQKMKDIILDFESKKKNKSNCSVREIFLCYEDFVNKLFIEDDIQDELVKLVGCDAQANALSNFFGSNGAVYDLQNNIEKVKTRLSELKNDKLSEYEIKTLDFLSEKAKKISISQLTHWSEYRKSGISGKVISWYSNCLRQEKDIKEQIEKSIIDLNKIKDVDFISAEIKNEADIILKLLQNNEIGLSEKLETYRALIGDIRTNLNYTYQEKYPIIEGKNDKEREKDEAKKRAYKIYKDLNKDIKLIPGFLGETKKKVYNKYFDSVKHFNQGLDVLKSFEEKLIFNVTNIEYATDDKIKQILETLRLKYKTLNSKDSEIKIKNIFSQFNIDKLLEQKIDKDNWNKEIAIWQADKKKYKLEITKDIKIINTKDAFEIIYKGLKTDWEKLKNKNDIVQMLDCIEFEKIRLAILTGIQNDIQIKSSDLVKYNYFETLQTYLKTIKKDILNKKDIEKISQAFIMSDIKGTLNKLSRDNFIERSVCQFIGADSKYPLLKLFKDKVENGKKWCISFDSAFKNEENNNNDNQIELLKKDGKVFTENDFIKNTKYNEKYLGYLRSSKYQMQFLDKTERDEKGLSWYDRQGVDINLSEYSIILERKIKINLDLNNQNNPISFEIVKNKDVVYVSIPFAIKPRVDNKELLLERKSYMGIDVGEYGLAYTIFEKQEDYSITVLDAGFIYEPLLHKIRDYLSTLKNNQQKGSFGMPSTKLARLRENAITSIRNRVHNIAIKYNAKPIYEYQISNFETGSNKVKVIYNSVKIADVGRFGSPADKLESNLIWGDGGKNFGKEVGAYATSYICSNSKCCYSPFNEVDENKKKENKKLTRMSQDEISKSNINVNIDWNNWRKERGNSAVYICQGCKNISDADIQASYWIGLKGYLKEYMKDFKDCKMIFLTESEKIKKLAENKKDKEFEVEEIETENTDSKKKSKKGNGTDIQIEHLTYYHKNYNKEYIVKI